MLPVVVFEFFADNLEISVWRPIRRRVFRRAFFVPCFSLGAPTKGVSCFVSHRCGRVVSTSNLLGATPRSSLPGIGALIPIAPKPARIFPGQDRKSPKTASAGPAGKARNLWEYLQGYRRGAGRMPPTSCCEPTLHAACRWTKLRCARAVPATAGCYQTAHDMRPTP